MENAYKQGIFQFKSKVNHFTTLPDSFRGENIASSIVILQLLMGKIVVYDDNDKVLYNKNIDYTNLPLKEKGLSKINDFNNVLGIDDITDINTVSIINNFFRNDKWKNRFIYEHCIDEITNYYISCDKSPSEGFIHIYRLLEFISYSFPLLFASYSKDYRGTYQKFKTFFIDSNCGELKFFDKFFESFFLDDKSAYNYQFDILLESNNLLEMKNDFEKSLVNKKKDYFNIEGDTLQIKYKDVQKLLINLRNRYFHMLIGSDKDNFLNINYDKNDIFKSLNPMFMNWFGYFFSTFLKKRILEEL